MSDPKIATGAFAEMALHYLPEWSPIPIKTVDGNKIPLVKGVTGYKGVYVDRQMAEDWMPRYGRDSIGLRVPRDVIGIDVDRYGDKAGARTLAALQGKWGALAPTWSTTSRLDGSGIFLYRLPDGVDAGPMKNPAGTFDDGSKIGGIDLVRYCHRFLTVFPTFHGREGGIHQYLWFNPEGESDPDEPVWPLPEDLPYLPLAWCEGLSTGRTYAAGDTKLEGKASDWLKARPKGSGPLCREMSNSLKAYLAEVTRTGRDGGCYPVANAGLFALVGNSVEGHAGAFLAVNRLWVAYRDAMGARKEGGRAPADVEREFTNSLRGAIESQPKHKYRSEDLCDWKLA